MLPHPAPTQQVHSTIEHRIILTLSTISPANEDAAGPPATPPPGAVCVCPCCGHQHGGYEPTASVLIDALTLILETARAAKAIVEGEVM
jgi:hypothetical protein